MAVPEDPHAATPVTSAADLEAMPLRAGRGYRRDDVEAFRAAALGLVGDLEGLAASLRSQVIDAQRAVEAGQGPAPIEELLARATPDQLRRAGAAAAGEALLAGIETARAVLGRAQAEAAGATKRLASVLENVEALIAVGARPDAALDELAAEVVRVRAALETGMTAGPPAQPPAAGGPWAHGQVEPGDRPLG